MHQHQFTLLVSIAILTTSLPTLAQQSGSTDQPAANQPVAQSQPTTTDLIGVGTTLLNNIFNPPSRSAEIAADAEVKKAKIAAEAEIAKEKLRLEANKTDKVTPLLTQWGVTRVNCSPGLVFINGLGNDTVCLQPSAALKSGSYTYDSTKQQLVRNNPNNSGSNNSAGNNNPNTSVSTSNNEQTTVRTVQSTKVRSSGQGF